MTDEALMSELRSLRSDIGQLNDRVVRLRYEDFRDVFVEQVRLSLGQEGRRSFETDMERIRGASACELKPMCMDKLHAAMAEVMALLDKGEVEEAAKVLDDVDALLCGNESPCLDDSCSSSALETVQRVRLVLTIFQGLRKRLEASARDPPIPLADDAEATTEGMEAALSPLSNSWRLSILRMLRKSERTLSEMSKALDMRTGHLQFHIKSLSRAGYISSDRRTKAYSITEKGLRALKGAERLVAEL